MKKRISDLFGAVISTDASFIASATRPKSVARYEMYPRRFSNFAFELGNIYALANLCAVRKQKVEWPAWPNFADKVHSPIRAIYPRVSVGVLRLLLLLAALFSANSSAVYAQQLQLDRTDTANVVAIKDFPDGSRPDNLYRLEKSGSNECKIIVEALNHRHRAMRRPGGFIFVSDRFLQSPLSMEMIELYPDPYVAAAKVHIGSNPAESWIVKEVSWNKPRYTESLFWVPAAAALTQLKGSEFWNTISGPIEGPEGFYENEILLSGDPIPYKKPISQVPVFLWDLVAVEGRPLVLSMRVMDDSSPQRIHVRVLQLRDRRHADELCLITSRGLIAGFSF